MTTRNFDALFTPKAVALIGASNQPRSVGEVVARNLYGSGFQGPILSVNPHEASIRSALSYRTIAELPVTPDLAIVATPAQAVPGVVAELGATGCRAAVVITAGLAGPSSRPDVTLKQAMLDAAKPHLLRIVGPNGLGFLSPVIGLNASFAHLTPARGDLAVLSQSGAVLTAMIDWAAANGVGFSHLVSLGDMADVDFGDLLDHLALDPATRAILLYVESITHARKFMSAARIAARSKPVILVKGGRSAAGGHAALSHTGALAGSDGVHQAAFLRAGLLQVDTLAELFESARTLTSRTSNVGGELMIVTNGGGAGVLAADEAERCGVPLATLDPAAVERLDAVLPAGWSRANPIDIVGDATGERYQRTLEIVAGRPGGATLLVMNCPTGVADGADCARAVSETAVSRPLLGCWLGEETAAAGRRILGEAGVPVYDTPEAAVRALSHLQRRRRNLEVLLRTPPPRSTFAADVVGARALIAGVLAESRTLLTAPEAKSLLRAYGVPVLEGATAADPAGAARSAAKLGAYIALKVLSPDITHKSDVGGVRLNIAASEVEAAAEAMLATVRAAAPKARLEGFAIEAMAPADGGVELIVGLNDDPTFGPVLLVGAGGVAVEVLNDKALDLPPLNLGSAREMIARTRVSRLLAGYRNVPPADVDAVAGVLVALSDMIVDLPELAELDINPLLAGPAGVVAVDARAVVRPATEGAGAAGRLALRPYPAELERAVALQGGTRYTIRPIRPEDEPALVQMGRRSTPEDMRLRFFGWVKSFPHEIAGRLSQIDYDREMALVALEDDGSVAGVSRLICAPAFDRAEFAVIVRSDLQGQGLGRALMDGVFAYARSRGIRRVEGEVLADNTNMLAFVRELGAEFGPKIDAGVVSVAFDLDVAS